MVVPEAYGFKSIKWLNTIVLTNLHQSNDTYADGNNDVDSWLKTFAATLSVPREVKPGTPFPVTGYAQVGLAGLSKVQVAIQSNAAEPAAAKPAWIDAQVLGPPKHWGDLPGGTIPGDTLGFDENGRPRAWPMRLAKVHWAILMPGLPAGDYTFQSRTVDDKGIAQPNPRPLRNSGHSAIETVEIKVAA